MLVSSTLLEPEQDDPITPKAATDCPLVLMDAAACTAKEEGTPSEGVEGNGCVLGTSSLTLLSCSVREKNIKVTG